MTQRFISSDPPEMLPLNFGKEINNEGDFAQLTCIIVSGDEPLSLSWSFHGRDVSAADLGVKIMNVGSRTSLLIIESDGHRHSGAYTCKAQNLAGSSSQTADLKVNG